MEKFYITTAIDYVNAPPHIGHAYEKIIADVLARWHRLKGEEVFYLTGVDENAQKNEQAAKAVGMPAKEFVDKNSKYFEDLCKNLNLSNDDFIKTTEERHVKPVQAIFKKLFDKGDIYKGNYDGLYCEGCEAYMTEKDLVNGKCPEHNKEPKWIKQESYFFKLSAYEQQILKLLKSKNFVVPEDKRNEMVSRVEQDGLRDLCVTRYRAEWGVQVPFDKDHRIYVWIDALSNYVTGLEYPNGKNFKKFWPADIHLVGKGINWFHSVIWPGILIASEIELPKTILVHSYLTVDGKKISKSLGTAIDPSETIKEFGTDPLRYFLIKNLPLFVDGDFSEEKLKESLNNELANDLGNLLGRTLTLVEKQFDGKVKGNVDKSLEKKLDLKKVEKYFEKYELHLALEEVWKFVRNANKYVNENKPWEKQDENVLYNLLESLRVISILLEPFIPGTCEKINKQLGVPIGNLKEVKFGIVKEYKVSKGEILFKKK